MSMNITKDFQAWAIFFKQWNIAHAKRCHTVKGKTYC